MPPVHVENKKCFIKLKCQSRPDLAFELCFWKKDRERKAPSERIIPLIFLSGARFPWV
jgi:hypothetical protein